MSDVDLAEEWKVLQQDKSDVANWLSLKLIKWSCELIHLTASLST